MRHKFDNI